MLVEHYPNQNIIQWISELDNNTINNIISMTIELRKSEEDRELENRELVEAELDKQIGNMGTITIDGKEFKL